MAIHIQHPSYRRVQAFIPISYQDRLQKYYCDKDIDILNKYIASATLLDDGTLACLICDPWPKYCPDYDKGIDPCQCINCDVKIAYEPLNVFKSVDAYDSHYKDMHHAPIMRTINWFTIFW